jgi:Na+-transporting NADH:ubiquinone oxidoreductase subunit A
MSKTIKIKKGLDIKLKGMAELSIGGEITSTLYGIEPANFLGLIPKLSVKPDEYVKIGTPLFYDKNQPEVKITSPVSGKVVAINRGDRRKILDIEIESDNKFESEQFSIGELSSINRDSIKEVLLSSGLWPYLIQRPFGIIAKPSDTPRDIFVSGFDSAPLAPSYDFSLANDLKSFQKGIDVLAKLTDGKVYLGVRSGSKLAEVKNAEVNVFDGPHPAGNVGIQIHHLKPINKGDKVWTVDPQAVVFIGRLFSDGKLNFSKIVSLTGSEVKNPMYYKTVVGVKASPIVSGKTEASGKERIIAGNVLTGKKMNADDYLNFYANQITVIPEGDNYEFLGWAMPRFNKFSFSRAYFSWLTPGKTYRADANLNGEERAYVMTGQYEKVLPMDILPVHLIKSIMADDIDKMELLGIYEVIEEDLALCEYVCTSKIEVQHILRKGIDLIVKELG